MTAYEYLDVGQSNLSNAIAIASKLKVASMPP